MTTTDDLRQRITAALAERYANSNPDSGMMAVFTADDGHSAIAPVTPNDVADAALAAIQGAYVPPSPGSDRDALPPDLRQLIEPQMPPYTSTGCQAARACFLAAEVFPDRADELLAWAEREHASCRITRKQDMAQCTCDCHHEAPAPMGD